MIQFTGINNDFSYLVSRFVSKIGVSSLLMVSFTVVFTPCIAMLFKDKNWIKKLEWKLFNYVYGIIYGIVDDAYVMELETLQKKILRDI